MKKRFLFVGFGLLLLSASPSVAQVAGFSEESGGIRKGQGQEVRIRGIRDSVVRIAPPCSGNIRQERPVEVLVPVKSEQKEVSRGDFKSQLCEMPVKAAPALMRKTDGGVPALASRREWTPSNPLAKSNSRLKSDDPVSVFMGTNRLFGGSNDDEHPIVMFTVQDNEVREVSRIQSPYYGYIDEDPDVQYPLFPVWGDWVGDGFVGLWGFQTSTANYYTGYIWFDPMSGEAYSLKYRNLNNMWTSKMAAYDESSDLMYVVSYEYNYESETYDGFDLRSFAIVDDSICFRDSVRLSGLPRPLTLSIDQAGAMYIIAKDGNLYSVDKENGVASLVAPTGKQLETSDGGTFLQSATFDHYTGQLFWFYVSTRGAESLGLVTVDWETAELTDIAESHDGERLSSQLGMMASVHYGNPAPLASDYFYVVDYEDEELVEFNWETPVRDENQDTLLSLDAACFYQVEVGEEEVHYIPLDSMNGIQPGKAYSYRCAMEEFNPAEDTLYAIRFKDGEGKYSAYAHFALRPVAELPYYNGFEDGNVEEMGCVRFRNPYGRGLAQRGNIGYEGYGYMIRGDYGTDSCSLDIKLEEVYGLYKVGFYVCSSQGEGRCSIAVNGRNLGEYAVSTTSNSGYWTCPQEEFVGQLDEISIRPIGDDTLYIDCLSIEVLADGDVPGQVYINSALQGKDRRSAILNMTMPMISAMGNSLQEPISSLSFVWHDSYDTLRMQGDWQPGSVAEVVVPGGDSMTGWRYLNVIAANSKGESPYSNTLVVYVGPGINLRGIVQDPSGKPLEGVVAEATASAGWYGRSRSIDTTDENGVYCLNVSPYDLYNNTGTYAVNYFFSGMAMFGMLMQPCSRDTVLDTITLDIGPYPVLSVTAEYEAENRPVVAWEQPELYANMGWINYSYWYERWSVGEDAFKYACRISPEYMEAMGLEDPKITDVWFVPGESDANVEYELVICQDTTQEIFRKRVVESYEGEVQVGHLYVHNMGYYDDQWLWNYNGISFDPEKDLWLIVEVKSGGLNGYPCVITPEESKNPGQGNLVYIDGQWQQLSDVMPSATGDVMIGIFIVDSAAGMDPTTGYRVYRGAEGAAFEEFSLLGEAIQDTFFIDKDFAGLEDGKYQYAVVAEWAKDSLSEAVYSEVVEKDLIVYPMPENLQVSVDGLDAILSWEDPADAKPESYQIYLDDAQEASSVTGTQYVFENLEPGTYTAGVVAVYADGESEMATEEFEIKKTGNEDLWGGVSIYPNPTDGHFSIEVPFACRMELYSATGSCLLVKELPQAGLYPVNLDLAEGGYTLRLVSGQEYSVFKIVVR